MQTITHPNENDLVPCASKSFCRAPHKGPGDHNCSKCKTQAHVHCMGANIEGGGKLCAMCVSPNGLCDFAKEMPLPEAPSWYKPPQRANQNERSSTAKASA